jgi:hypothetical protein
MLAKNPSSRFNKKQKNKQSITDIDVLTALNPNLYFFINKSSPFIKFSFENLKKCSVNCVVLFLN